MVRLEYNAFEPACVPVSAWIYLPRVEIPTKTTFVDLSEFKGIENQAPRTLAAISDPTVDYCFDVDCSEFLQIPNVAFAYQVSARFRASFRSPNTLADSVDFTGSQNVTGKNAEYVRRWWEVDTLILLALCNSVFAERVFDVLNPTLNLQVQDVKSLPIAEMDRTRVRELAGCCTQLARRDWDSRETSWGFELFPLTRQGPQDTLRDLQAMQSEDAEEMQTSEEELNVIIADAYEFTSDLPTSVAPDQVTLQKLETDDIIKRLISYAIGCMMGRYSLDEPGLFYAHSGNEGFDPAEYKTIPTKSLPTT